MRISELFTRMKCRRLHLDVVFISVAAARQAVLTLQSMMPTSDCIYFLLNPQFLCSHSHDKTYASSNVSWKRLWCDTQVHKVACLPVILGCFFKCPRNQDYYLRNNETRSRISNTQMEICTSPLRWYCRCSHCLVFLMWSLCVHFNHG